MQGCLAWRRRGAALKDFTISQDVGVACRGIRGAIQGRLYSLHGMVKEAPGLLSIRVHPSRLYKSLLTSSIRSYKRRVRISQSVHQDESSNLLLLCFNHHFHVFCSSSLEHSAQHSVYLFPLWNYQCVPQRTN